MQNHARAVGHPGGGDPWGGLGELRGGRRGRGGPASAPSHPRRPRRLAPPGTDLPDALRPRQDFGPGCAGLSAPARGSSWGRRRPDAGAGREPGNAGSRRPPSALTPPPSRRWALWTAARARLPGRTRSWGSGALQSREQSRGPWHRVPLAGPESAGCRAAFTPQSRAAPGLAAAAARAPLGDCERRGAFSRAPRKLPGRGADAGTSSCLAPQPFAPKRWHPSHCFLFARSCLLRARMGKGGWEETGLGVL